MSRIHRAVEKAEREGLLTWTTRPGVDPAGRATAVEEPPSATGPETVVRPPGESRPWEVPREGSAGFGETSPPSPGFDGTAPPSPGLDGTSTSLGEGRSDEVPFSPLFVVATDPGSAAAEQFRLLRTRLEARDKFGRTQLLLVTSPRLGEGKTTTSANLALAMSQEFQHKVVLVEADLRRPTLAALFGVQEGPGLADVLMGAATLDDALVAVPGHHLFLLPAGAAATRSTELFGSPAMQRIVDGLRARFDRIVVDTPPVTLADTHVLARMADGVLIVVRAGVTPRPAVERALAGVDRQRLMGIVLNEVDEKPDEYAYPGQYARASGE